MGGRSTLADGTPPPDPEKESKPSFEWDEVKRQSNIAKHHLDFEDAKQIWDGRARYTIDSTRDSEFRQLNISKIGDKLYYVISTIRGDKIRLISFRRANSKEIRIYEQFIK